MSDPVNHPSHYTSGQIECIDAIKEALGQKGFESFLQGQCLKYLWRYQHKGAAKQDLQKCRWYLERLILETV